MHCPSHPRRRQLLALSLAAAAPALGRGATDPPPAGSVAQVPRSHPRLGLRAAELDSLRRFVHAADTRGEVGRLWATIRSESPLETRWAGPAGTAIGLRDRANAAGFHVMRRAMVQLVEPDAATQRELAGQLDDLVGWPLRSMLHYRAHDAAFIQLLRPALFAYDWLAPTLDEARRTAVRQDLVARLETLWAAIRRRLPDERPQRPAEGASHEVRHVATLGLGALALAHDEPRVHPMLDWVLDFYLHRFPVWGGDDGGWSEGIDYWSSGLSQHLRLLEDLGRLGHAATLQRPFWRHTGYFGAYFLLPYEASSFGDLAGTIRPNPTRMLLLRKLARLNHDGTLLAFSRTLGTAMPSGSSHYGYNSVDSLLHLWRESTAPGPAPASLADLPPARHFRDVGWVALHSHHPGDAEGIMLGFKSSPIGSISHAFADQNAFVLNAFGRPLAVASGVRDQYGSQHYERWTRATRSHNAVLVGGRGIPERDPSATGRIVRFVSMAQQDFTTGDASAAYRRIASRVLRHVYFVDRRFFVMLDEIDGDEAVPHQWLLHGRVAARLEPRTGTIEFRHPDAGLVAQILTPAPGTVGLTQSDRYEPPPVEPPGRTFAPEWHVTAQALPPARSRRFLAVLTPWRGKVPPAAADRITCEVGHGLRVGDDIVLISEEATARTTCTEATLEGRAAHLTPYGVSLVEARRVTGSGFDIASDRSLSLALARSPTTWTLEALAPDGAELRIAMPGVPVRIEHPPAIQASIDAAGRLVVVLPASEASQRIRLHG